MAVKAWLEGRSIDMETLARLFPEGKDPHVGADDAGYYLTSSAFERLHDGEQLHGAATTLLTRVNGVARVLAPGFRPIGLTESFYDDIGRRHTVVLASVAEASVSVGIKVVNGEGQELPPPPSPASHYAGNLAGEYSVVAKVLSILGQPRLTWYELYKVHELVQEAVGGIPAGWASRADLSAFGASANHPAVSGSEARHAVQKGRPPKRTMSLSEGEQLIRDLVRRWLESLS